MDVDYIIVGLGLAGIAFAEELTKQKRSFVVFEDQSQNSSLVAGGMYNPVILKRFTPVWNALEQLDLALPYYKELENKFGTVLQYGIDIYRIFKSIEEQNNWFLACDNILLENYMSQKIVKNSNEHILAPYHFGKLHHTGRIDVKKLVNNYKDYLRKNSLILEKTFKHKDVLFLNSCVSYGDLHAKRIVFCEGYGLKDNLFFNYLPMKEVKGELITIYAPKLKIDFLIKAALFVLPIGIDLYKVGATFNWKDKTKDPTVSGREELIRKLETFLKCSYEIIDHTAGIRPTISDRRPLIGVHPDHDQIAVLNGLGTRGVMIAPLMAQKLFEHLENDLILEKEISIERFEKNYFM